MKLKPYYVSSGGLWFVVYAKNKLQAKQEGIEEFGFGQVRELREATKDEVESYKNQRPKLIAEDCK